MSHEDIDYYASKYPKSINNRQCIGPCYPKNMPIVHPHTMLTWQGPPGVSICPVIPYEEDGEWKQFDVCHTKEKKFDRSELETHLLTPEFTFTDRHFLSTYYQIDSFEALLKYLKRRPSLPYPTAARLLNSGWRAYGSLVDPKDTNLLTIYIRLLKERSIPTLFPILNPYLKVVDSRVSFAKPVSKPSTDYRKEKINYLIDRLFNHHIFGRFFDYYTTEYEGRWTQVTKHQREIEQHLGRFLIRVIEESIGK